VVPVTIIQVSCPLCGVVRLDADQVTLRSDLAQYHFKCPKCWGETIKPADGKVSRLLVEAGAVVADPERVSPALTLDDLIEFHEHLDDEIEALLG
jgi:hypothetical protein